MHLRRVLLSSGVLAVVAVGLAAMAFVRFAPSGGWRLLALAGALLGVALGVVLGRLLAGGPMAGRQPAPEASQGDAAPSQFAQTAQIAALRTEEPASTRSLEPVVEGTTSEMPARGLAAEWMTADAIIEAISDLLLVLSPEGTVLIANQAAARMLGRSSRDEMMGIPVAALLGEPRECEQHSDLIDVAMRHSGIKNWSKWTAHRLWSDIVRRGGVQDAEVEFRHMDGSSRPMMVNGSVMRGSDGQIESVVILARDQRKAQRALVTGTHEAVARIAAVQQATGSSVTPMPELASLIGMGEAGPAESFFGQGPTLSQQVGGTLVRIDALMGTPGLTLTQREQLGLVRTDLVAQLTIAQEIERTTKGQAARKSPAADPRRAEDPLPQDGSARVSRVSLRQAAKSRARNTPPPASVGADSSPEH